VEPGNPHSSIARWLYCDAPVDAYTLHAYDWVSRQRGGDMPIDWDLDNIVSQPCPNGRALPVLVEELGTSRALAGMYAADDEQARLEQERRQIEFVRHFPKVIGFGVWNAESPRLLDRTFIDVRRGLTSYGKNAQGGGSCYDPTPEPSPGARCQLEQVLRGTPFVRESTVNQWFPGPDADASTGPAVGSLDPVFDLPTDTSVITLTGWVADSSADDAPGVQSVDALADGLPIAHAQLGLARLDAPVSSAGFSITLPLSQIQFGPTPITLAARLAEGGTWLTTLQVVNPSLGPVPPARPVIQVAAPPQVTPVPRLAAEVEAPQPGDQVSRSFNLEVLAPAADRVDVFLEPDRDHGGRLVGTLSQTPGPPFRVSVVAPVDAHTLYVHVSSSALGQEQVLTVPVIVRS
jgi:hypothetical protein